MAARGQAMVVEFHAWDTSANAPKTGDAANITLRWVKDGTSAALATGTVTEVDATNAKGIYKCSLSGTETDCLSGKLCGVSSTANIAIFGPNIFFDQIPVAVAGASGGLLIAGSNAATTFASMTSTGAFTISDGLIVTTTTSNRPGIQSTGSGTGAGVLTTGGTTGDGIKSVGGPTNGHGMLLTSPNADGLGCVGQAAGARGVHFLGGDGGTGMICSAGVNGSGAIFIGDGTQPGASYRGGNTSGHGAEMLGNGTGNGLSLQSGTGATGNGLNIVAASTNGDALHLFGAGTGSGFSSGGGATGNGMSLAGGATSGDAIYLFSQSNSTGIRGNITGNLIGDVTALSTATKNAITQNILQYSIPEGYSTLGSASTYQFGNFLFDIHRRLYARSVAGTAESIYKMDGVTIVHGIALNSATAPTQAIQSS